MDISKIIFKSGIVLSCSCILSGAIVPVVSAAEITTSQKNIVKINEQELAQNILKDIKSQMLPELQLNQKYQDRGAAGLMATLIAKYGVIYVKKTLPKLIYKHVAGVIGRKVSEATFVKVFANVVDWGTGAVLERPIANGLKSVGVDSRTAEGVASTIVTVAYFFV